MKKLTLLFISLLSLISICTHPIFYNVTVLCHKGTGQRVFLLSDVHIDTNDMCNTLTQREDLVCIVKKFRDRGESIYFLVEDNASPHCEQDDFEVVNDQSWKKLFLNYSEQLPQWTASERICSPMSLLEKWLLWDGISAKNIDTRPSIERDANGVLREVDQQLRLERYMQAYNNMRNTIESETIKQKLLQFIDTYPEAYLERGAFMVDVAAIDAIYQHTNIHNIVVCAGGGHNENIVEFLLSTGDYEQVMSFGDDFDQHAQKVYASVDAGGLVPLCPLDLNQTFAQAQCAIEGYGVKQA